MLKSSLALAALLFATSCATVENSGSRPVVKSGFMGMSEADAVKDQGNLEHVFGSKKIALPYFNVQYIQQENIRRKDTSVTIDAKLEGVSRGVYQAITDFAYNDLSQKLTAAGYQVMPVSAMQQFSSFTKLPAVREEAGDSSVKSYAQGTRQVDRGIFNYSSKELVKQSGATMLDVDYRLHFAFPTTNKGLVFDRRSSAAKSVINVQGFVGAAGGGNVMQTKLQFGTPPYSDTVAGNFVNVTSTGRAALDYAKTWALGGNSKKGSYILKADEQKYVQAAREALVNANSAIIKHLAEELK